MKKVKEFLKIIGYNAFFGTCLFLGTVKGIHGFMNLVSFLIWIVFIALALIVIVLEVEGEDAWKKIAEGSEKKNYPEKLSKFLTVIYISTLVYYGHVILAVVYLISSFIGNYVVKRVESFREDVSK